MNEHFKSERRSNFHTLLFYFVESSKKICSPPPNISNVTKVVQFNKGMGKIWGV
jgi:hypothetical protein